MTRRIAGPLAWGVAALLLAIAGLTDLVTGTEVQVLAVYFFPLLWAGWTLGVRGSSACAVAAALVWLGVLYVDGIRFVTPYVWVVNGLMQGAGFLIVTLLVSSLRAALERERAASRLDPLTGLQNRRAFHEAASQSLASCARHARAVSIVWVDLDNFKQANDVRGHDFGDRLLIESAGILNEVTRKSDVVARWGGDEFVLFLPETSAEQAAVLLERIVMGFEISNDMREAGVSVSAGVHSASAATTTLTELLRCADAEMYRSKRDKGRSSAAAGASHSPEQPA